MIKCTYGTLDTISFIEFVSIFYSIKTFQINYYWNVWVCGSQINSCIKTKKNIFGNNNYCHIPVYGVYTERKNGVILT